MSLRTLPAAFLALSLEACNATPYYEDHDQDGFGQMNGSTYVSIFDENCEEGEKPVINSTKKNRDAECMDVSKVVDGVHIVVAKQSGDCDDSQKKNFPGNAEVFDELDNDCDEIVDLGALPASAPQLKERIKMDQKVMFGTDPTRWDIALQERLGDSEVAYGLSPEERAKFANPGVQEDLYQWALPYVKWKLGSASAAERKTWAVRLDSAKAYGASMDLTAERAYLAELRAMDCSDVLWSHSWDTVPGSCEGFFLEFGPKEDWKGEIQKIRTAEPGDESTRFFEENKARETEAFLFRRVENGDMTPEEIKIWTARIHADLYPVLGVAMTTQE